MRDDINVVSAVATGAVPLNATVLLTAVAVYTPDGIQVYIGGGTKPHIGAVAISSPRPSLSDPRAVSCTTSIIAFPGHKEESVARLISEGLCKHFHRNTVVSAGFHIEDITETEIEDVLFAAEKLLTELLKSIQ